MLNMNVLCQSSPIFNRLTEGMSEQERCQVKVCFYVISDKTFTFKKILIEEMTLVEEIDQLKRWTQEKRLVTAVEKGNQIYAFASSGVTEKFKDKNLSIEGKKVDLQILSDSEYEHIIKIGELVRKLLESNLTSKKKTNRRESNGSKPVYKTKAVSSRNLEISNLLRKLETCTNRIKQNILKKWAEDILEKERLKKEDEKRHRIKKEEIEKRELEKRILNDEINKDEIERRELFLSLVKDCFTRAEQVV